MLLFKTKTSHDGPNKKFGIFATIYSFIAISPKSSILTLLGLCGSLKYLQMLFRDIESVDAIGPTPTLKVIESKRSKEKIIKTLLLAYSFAFQPRLLVLVFLAFSCWLYN